MSIEPFYNEAQVPLSDGFVLRLVIDFAVIDRLEGLTGKGMDELLGLLATSTSVMGKFLWAMTRRYHNEVESPAYLSLDQVAGVQFSREHGQAVAATLGNLVRQTFNVGSKGEGEKGRPPRQRSGGASRTSSKNGSRQASAQQTSGRKRRVHS